MKFFKKNEAINHYNKIKDKSIKSNSKLFQEDVDRAGTKCFYVCSPKKIFDRIEKLAEPHFYEFWTDQTNMVFGMDIDYDTSKDDTPPDELLKKIINIVIDGANKYYDHKYKMKDIIILENDNLVQKLENPNKYSAHIVFRGLNFESCIVAKDFFLRLDKDYGISKLYVDKSIYNMTCLRLFMNSKMGKHAVLLPKKLIIDGASSLSTKIYENTKNIKDFYNFFLTTMLTHTNPADKMIMIKDLKNKIDKCQSPQKVADQNDIANINIESILMNLPGKYYDEYDEWIKIGMVLHTHHTEENNLYDIWNNWSMQSDKYKEREMLSKWKSFANSKKRLTIGTLIKIAKEEGIVNIYKNNKQNIEDIVNNYPAKPININTNNINDSQITILDQKFLTSDIYYPIIDKKLIAVQSEKGTGKTSNLFNTLFGREEKSEDIHINDNTSILFISSRITFGYKLLGDLKEYGFELYSQITDHQIYSKRIICQIDSLLRLERDSYDIIIVDECESLARYMTSSHFTKNNKASFIISNLEMRVNDAKQVYILDADLSDRCINFYKKNMTFDKKDDFHLVINNFKPYSEYKLTYCQYATWLRKILLILESNKKLVIAMASNSKAKDLDKKIRDTYPEKKVLLIHKETTDEDKKKFLLKVNEEWINYDVIIYTPSVCMGVSFDITGHFDHIFAYGCHESLGAQEWCQMIHRVRSPKSKEIFIAIDQYKVFDTQDDNVNYNTVEKMLCSDYYLTNYDLHNNIVTKKIKRIKNNDELLKLNDLDRNMVDDSDDEFNDSAKQEMSDGSEGYVGSVGSVGSVAINDKVLFYPYKSEPIYDLYVRNSWELIENKLNFPACFFGYAKYKSYQLNYLPLSEEDNYILQEMKVIRNEREDQENEDKINGIYAAPDLSYEDYQNKIKQRDEYITPEDVYAIQRYNFRKCYNITPLNADEYNDQEAEDENLTKDIIIEYNDKEKMKWFRNMTTILATNSQTTEEKLEILKDNKQFDSAFTNCYIDFTVKNQYSFHYYPISIIQRFQFNINNLTICFNQPDIYNKLENIISWCEDKIDDIAFKYNIKTSAKKLSDLAAKDRLKYVNRIIESQYGLRIRRINTSVHEENILYRLDDNGIWSNLPDIENNNEDNMYSLQMKILPIDLKLKRNNYYSNDSPHLDRDLFIDDE